VLATALAGYVSNHERIKEAELPFGAEKKRKDVNELDHYYYSIWDGGP
jgi:hypothetical protein